MKTAILTAMTLPLLATWAAQAAEKEAKPEGAVSIRDFADRAVDGDWSPAIQAAIDHVTAANGYENGATVFVPPGTYTVNRTVVLGQDPAHYGTRLSGYGAVLVGTETLDGQPAHYEERKRAFEENGDKFSLQALPGELDFDGETHVGIAILELWDPPGQEGASYVIEGLTFTRESNMKGVGIKIPAETVPKNVTFRDIKVHRQNVGVHLNHVYQIRFESCIIRGGRIGIWGRNHFNSVSILNSSIRRQHLHGIVIGPNAGTWGSSGIYIAGCILEEIKGYGILNAGGLQVAIVNNYFEMVGNSIGILSPYGNTTVDTCHFWGNYGHGWKMNHHKGQLVADRAHLVVDSPNVQLRNNRYAGVAANLVFSLSGASFDAPPTLAEGFRPPHGTRVPHSRGHGAYVYDAESGEFTLREWHLPTAAEAAAEAEAVESGRRAQARAELAQARQDLPATLDAAKSANEKVTATFRIAELVYKAEGDYEAARAELRKALQFPARDQTHLRALIQMRIADTYFDQQDYAAAVEAYTEARKTGPGGWHKDHIEKRLQQAAERAARAGHWTYACGVCAQVYDQAKGDPEREIPAGTKFEMLPDDWTCPACDGAKNRFFEPQP